MTPTDSAGPALRARQTVISIEKGHFDSALPLVFRFSRVFDCRIEGLFTPEDWHPRD